MTFFRGFIYVLIGSPNSVGLEFRWAQSKLGLTIDTSVALPQQIQGALLLHFNQVQTNPGAQDPQTALASNPAPLPLHKPPFILLMDLFVLVQGKCEETFYCCVSFDLHSVCCKMALCHKQRKG